MLPREREDLGESLISREIFDSAVSSFKYIDIYLYLPKFKIEMKYDLKGYLRAMGLRDALTERAADFSGISEELSHIGNATHNGFIEVDEQGTTAAAFTSIGFGTTSMPESIEFRANHPFIYYIVENSTGTILFMGRYSQPK
jgi:serpin B